MAKFSILGNVFQKNEDTQAGKPAIELTYTKEKNTPIAKLTVQESRTYGRTDENKSDFWSVSILGKTAEFVAKNFRAGSPISMSGEIYHSKGSDGKTYDNIAITEVQFVPKDFSQPQQGGGTQPAPQQAQGTAQPAQQGYVQPNPPQGGQVVQFQAQQTPQPAPQPQAQPAPQAQPQAQPNPPQAQPAPQGDIGFGTYNGFEPPQGVNSNGF